MGPQNHSWPILQIMKPVLVKEGGTGTVAEIWMKGEHRLQFWKVGSVEISRWAKPEVIP